MEKYLSCNIFMLFWFFLPQCKYTPSQKQTKQNETNEQPKNPFPVVELSECLISWGSVKTFQGTLRCASFTVACLFLRQDFPVLHRLFLSSWAQLILQPQHPLPQYQMKSGHMNPLWTRQCHPYLGFWVCWCGAPTRGGGGSQWRSPEGKGKAPLCRACCSERVWF